MNQKVTANIIQKHLIDYCKRGFYDIVIPNFFYGLYECDLFQVSKSGYITEYEIKISRSDFFNDFKKNGGAKHKAFDSPEFCHLRANRFVYVVPEGLVSVDEVPAYAGLLYYKPQSERFEYKKSGKLVHKTVFKDFQSIAYTLSKRDKDQRKRIEKIRNIDFDKEMNRMKREVEAMKQEKNDMVHQKFVYVSLLRKHKIEIP